MLTFSLSCVLLWTYHAAARADYQDYLHQALDYWSLRALNLIRDTKLGIERIMDSMTDSKSGSGQTTAGQTPSYSIYPLWDQKYFSDPLAWIRFLLGYSFVLVGSGVADFRWQNWNTTEAVQPSTPRVPSSKKHRWCTQPTDRKDVHRTRRTGKAFWPSKQLHILMSSHTFQREELWANFELPPVPTATRFHV